MDTKTRPLHMLSTRDPPQNRGHIQTESEKESKLEKTLMLGGLGAGGEGDDRG